MRILRIGSTLCLALFLALPAVGAGQPAAPSKTSGPALQLLQKAQKAMGGADKLAAIKDTTQTMTVTLAPPFEKKKISQTTRYIAAGNLIRQEQDGYFGKSVIYSDGYSGHKTSQKGTNPLLPEGIAAARGALFRQMCTLMLSDRDPSRTVNAVGANAVEIFSSEGQRVKIEFDPKTGLPLKLFYPSIADGKPATRTETLSDWRDVSGVRFPFHSVQVDGEKPVLELTVSSYQVNTGLTSAELSKN